MPKSLALELLETILSAHADVFLMQESSRSFAPFVRDKVCPVLIRSFGGRCDWRLMVRMMRTAVVLLVHLRPILGPEDVQTLVFLLLRMLDDGSGPGDDVNAPRYVTPVWHRVLTLETLNLLCSHQDFLGELQDIHDDVGQRPASDSPPTSPTDSSAFLQVVEALCALVSSVLRQPQVAQGIDAIAARPTKGLNLLSEEEPPENISESLVALLAAECLASIADSMALSKELVNDIGRAPSPVVQIGKLHSRDESTSPAPLLSKHTSSALQASPVVSESSSSQDNDDVDRPTTPSSGRGVRRAVVRQMMEICWKPMLRALATLLQHCNNENVVQFILKAYMSMTNTCGMLDLVEPRNAFIMSLCNFSLPNWHSSAAIMPMHIHKSAQNRGSELAPKHLQALKALFNIAHGLGSILGSAWHIVLETFEQLDHIMFCLAADKRRTSSGTVHVTGHGPSGDGRSGSSPSDAASFGAVLRPAVDDEIAIVESMLAYLFDSTRFLDEEALIQIQTALTQLSFTVLAHAETMRNVSMEPLAKPAVRESWISSITTSIADAASGALTSVAYNEVDGDGPQDQEEHGIEGEIEDDDDQSDHYDSSASASSSASSSFSSAATVKQHVDEFGVPDLGIDLSKEKHAFKRPPGSKSAATMATEIPGSAGGNAASSVQHQRVNSASRPDTTHHGADVVDGVVARATYRNPPFAIEKLVETTRLNTFRVGLLWEMTQNVLSTVASKSDPKLRLYGVQAMETLVVDALLFEEPPSMHKQPGASKLLTRDKSHSTGSHFRHVAPPRDAARSGKAPVDQPSVGRRAHSTFGEDGIVYPPPRALQKELLEGFSHLFKSHFSDAREATLQSMYRIIGTCGHVLERDGWEVIVVELAMITGTLKPSDRTEAFTMPEYSAKDIAKLVPSAFKAVQLIVDDFLPALPFECKKTVAHCIAAFGKQEPHVNISLTAVTMLWTMCDQVQKECPDLDEEARSTSPMLTNLSEEDARRVRQCNALLVHLVEQLSELSLDKRPEVRNCAVRTLCSVVVACAPKLLLESWRTCTLGIVFPLLNEIISCGSQAPTDQVHGEVLGRISGERTRVHHSLDTLEKQWRETIVTAIQGTTRVVRAAVQFAGHTDWSLKCWEILLNTIESTLKANPTNKVALAATRTLHDLGALVTGGAKARFAAVGMQVVDGALVHVGAGGMEASPQRGAAAAIGTAEEAPLALAKDTPVEKLWGLVWGVYDNATQGAPPKGVHSAEVATDIVSGLGELYGNPRAKLLREPAQVIQVLQSMTRLLTAFPAKSKHITGLERAVLTTTESLPPVADSVWPQLFLSLRTFMHGNSNGMGFSDVFADKAQELFIALFEKHAPSSGRALVFEDTIESILNAYDIEEEGGLGDSEDRRSQSALGGPWGVESLLPIFRFGLRSLSTCGWLSSRVEDAWMNLLLALRLILLPGEMVDAPSDGATGSSSNGVSVSVIEGLKLLDAIVEEARPLIVASCVPAGVQDRLLELLRAGCAAGDEPDSDDASGIALSRACLDHLLTLTSFCVSDSQELAEQVLLALMNGIEHIVSSFAAKRGAASSEEEEEIVRMLVKLRGLDLSHVPIRFMEKYHPLTMQSCGSKCHLLLLFPVLNQLVVVDSLAVRTELQLIFASLSDNLVQRAP
ncbi:Protein MON2 homolog [Durusdinium trenchii]|uniref:Protein MON2 homolog n=1 Tax=Durusdinium trenchii TaxID=1381693 RepID=A0ABP0ITS1_9DINO